MIKQILQKTVGFLKVLKEVYDAQIELPWTILFTTNIMELEGVRLEIFDAPVVLKAYGLLFACVRKEECSGEIHYRVFTDENFSLCSEETKQFILYHELGHIKNGDLDGKRNRLAREISADDYAASKLGKDIAFSALQEIYDIKPLKSILKRQQFLM